MSPILNKWYYASDGDKYARTRYAWRESDKPPYMARRDFPSRKEAMHFIFVENNIREGKDKP